MTTGDKKGAEAPFFMLMGYAESDASAESYALIHFDVRKNRPAIVASPLDLPGRGPRGFGDSVGR